MSITNGTYRAKAHGECMLGTFATGTDYIELYFQILDGDNKGGLVKWVGFFTEATNERTIESLVRMGWQGEDPSEFADGKLHGADKNEVAIVVELEEYEVVDKETGQKTGELRHTPKVQWVNRAGGYLNTERKMNPQAAASFGERLRGLVMKVKEKNPQKKPTAAATTGGTPAADPNADPIPF